MRGDILVLKLVRPDFAITRKIITTYNFIAYISLK